MTIKVYWACIEDEWMRATEPEPVSKLFYKSNLFEKTDPGLDMNRCPAFNDNLKNVFALRSIYSYEFSLYNGNVVTNDYDQEFFDKHVTVKSYNKKLISFRQSYVFFTDSSSLKVTLSEHPFLEDNDISKNLLVLPGTLDIGKWFRNTDTMFYMRDGVYSFKILEGEVYGYVRFHTDEPIEFIQYRHTEELNSYLLDSIRAKNNKKLSYPMSRYYKMFSTKKLILKEIEKSIIQ